MIKNNKLKFILLTLIILLPILAGVILWDKLPSQMPIHWGPSGEVDGYASRGFAVFFFPVMMAVMFWICLVVSTLDNKNRNQNKKAQEIVWWIIPCLSVVMNTVVYLVALGKEINMGAVMCLLMGVFFVVIGNYMPKIKQNRTLGIKIKWALENEENWNATHRLAGKLWFFGGFAVMLLALLPEKMLFPIFFILLFPLVFIPVVYSWCYSKKQNKEKKNEDN